MERESSITAKSGTLPPIETVSIRKSKKSTKSSKVAKVSAQPKVTDGQQSKSKQAQPKDLSAAHPAMIGVDLQSLHPFSSELIDGLYKRPVVVSMLVPKKKVKNFKYEPSKRAASPTNAGEESDGQSGKRSPSRPSSRSESRSEKKKNQLKVFVIKVYDLVESKEGIYSVVVREFDKLLEDLIQEEGSTAVCDYFQPQSLDWWAKSLRHVLNTFDKPNGELSVAVDKKLIRKMVTHNMTHHVWMKANLTAEQIKAAKFERSESMKKRVKTPAKRKSAADMELIMQELPWNDYTAMGDRNPPPVQRAGTSSSGASARLSNSVKSLPPVSRPKSPTVQTFEVGDWVRGNFKRAGQWYPGIVKKVHKDCEYYDINYDDGRAETKVEAKLVRKSGNLRSSGQFDSVDMLDSTELDASTSHDLQDSQDPSQYDYGAAFSPGATSLEQSYDSAYESTYDSAYEGAYDSTYETDASQLYDDPGSVEESGVAYEEPSAEDNAGYEAESTEPVYDEHALTEADYHIDGVDTAVEASGLPESEDYNNHAYDYTNQVVIGEESAQEQHAYGSDYTAQEAQGSQWEVADGAELQLEGDAEYARQVVVAYISELIDSVELSNYPQEATDYVAQDEYVEYEHLSEETPAAVQEELQDIGESQGYDDSHAEPTYTLDPTDSTYPEDTIGFEPEVVVYDPVSQREAMKPTPSQIALRSLLQTMSLEENSQEGSTAQSKAKKNKKKARKTNTSQTPESSSTSLILGTESVSAVSVADAVPRRTVKPRTAGTAGAKTRKIKAVTAPDGLFPAAGDQRVKTASGPQPPNIEEYVARAAVSPPKVRANTSHKSSKSKKLKPKSAKPTPMEKEIVVPPPVKQVIYGNGLAKLGKPATAPVKDLHRGITFEGEESEGIEAQDHDSVTSLQSVHTHETHNSGHTHHSHQSHHSHTSFLQRGPHHHGPDAHGNFDHSDLPHYPYPHHSREEQKKLAIEAITKPHSNPMDRYTYVMMPAPLHMLQPVHGHGHDGNGHHHHGHHSNHHGHGHHGEHSGDSHSTHSHHPHHSQHSQVHDQHLHGEISPLGSRSEDDFAHHSAPFVVRNILDQTMLPHHHHDFHGQLPADFSETFHTGHSMPNSPDKHAHGHHGHHSASNTMSLSTTSLPTLPHIHRNTQSRPTSGSIDPHHSVVHHAASHGHANDLADVSVSVTDSSARPQSKSKGRAVSPFAHKNRYKGPQRRVLDIIEWARVSTGGSEQKQNRKISKVEKRLLKSPLALKLIVDSPLNVADLIDEVHKR